MKQIVEIEVPEFPKFTFDDVLALQCCMEIVKKVQEDKELYEKLNLIHSKMYDAYRIEKQNEQASLQNNKNIDLTKILKDCPEGTKLYSPLFGEVYFNGIRSDNECAITITEGDLTASFTEKGVYYPGKDGECLLFPSKEQRDWSKFSAPWYKKKKFNPKTLKPFDKVLISINGEWQCDFFSHMLSGDIFNKCCIGMGDKNIVIPYNDETKHLVGTANEAPDFYRY